MHNKTSTLPLPDHTLLSTSIVQHSQSLACRKGCHLGHRRYATTLGCDFAPIDVRKSPCLISLTGDDCAVSTSEALQLPSCPTIPAPPLVSNSSLVGHLNREQDSVQVAFRLGYITGENGASSIVSPAVNQGWDMQDHVSDHVTSYHATLSLPYTSFLQPYSIGHSSGYPQENVNVSTSGGLDHGAAGPTMGPSSMRPFHRHTSGQVIDSNALWSGLSSPLLSSLQELYSSDDLPSTNVPLPPEQIRTEMVAPAQLLSSFTPPPPTPFPYTRLAPSQSSSTTYTAADDNVSSRPPSLTSNQISSSRWSPQGHLGYPFTVHSHHTTRADLPGFHGFHAGTNIELHTAGTVDNRTTHILNDYPLFTPSNHKAHIFGNHETYILDDHTAGMTSGGIGDYGSFDKSRWSSEQVVDPSPQSLPPPNQFPPSPYELHSHDHVSHTESGNPSGTFCHPRRFATLPSRSSTRLPKARSACDRNAYKPCGWRDVNGSKCGMLIRYGDCADHFATIHDIKNIAWDVKVICCWCSSKAQKRVMRKNLLRHLREVHLCCLRLESGTKYTDFAQALATDPLFLT